jgi:hypothetical protein
MTDLEYWTKKLREAEADLVAATRRSDVNAAAKRVMLGQGGAEAARGKVGA